MVSKGALLRNIRPSGGLFTENILLRLRDNPTQLKIGKIETFNVSSKKELDKKQSGIFEWCKQKWDEISPNIDSWKLEELIEKWLIPFFEQFDHELEHFEMNENNVDEDSPIKGFKITHQFVGHKNPYFHFIDVNEEFDSKISSNPQGKSHHNICQQFINHHPEIEWLIISNGRILRLLTKYYHTYSKGFLEFDIENILANRDLVEFKTLYSALHSSRYIAESKDKEALINQFQNESVSEGFKIGNALMAKVHDAIELLGDELIQQNPNFLEKILANEINPQDYYAGLLRIIYRIIFILYAEQREMLPGAGSIYFEQLSLSSLRFLAEKPIKAEKNTDLWNKLFITFKLINEGNDFLGVNAYNGSLFKSDSLTLVHKLNLKISNEILLQIIKLLTTSKNYNTLQRINYLEISEEEIGAVYEALLDYKPNFNQSNNFELIKGIERKSTGSYYTPKVLIDSVINSALQPLIKDLLVGAGNDIKQREKAILEFKLCDPACGSGAFLLSALDFLGKVLAEVKKKNPTENELREARRKILQYCIYGVDLNPLAVELTKISLWLRASVKDKPLSFLDNHIKCGNSLIGLGPKIEIREIDPIAFYAISGEEFIGLSPENKKLQNMARERIKKEIKERNIEKKPTLITSFLTERRTADICSTKFQEIINLTERKPINVKQKEIKYKKLLLNENYLQALNEANIWASTYFWPLEGDTLGEIPSYTILEQLRDKILDPELENLMREISKIAQKFQIFHWYVEFPEIFSSERMGFDCILSNPPWERIKITDKEFFTNIDEEIINTKKASKRKELMRKKFKKSPQICENYKNVQYKSKKISNFIKNSGFYDDSAVGDINTYLLFSDRILSLLSQRGRAGIIVPTGIATDYYSQKIFNKLIDRKKIVSLYDFENGKIFFPKVHASLRFSLLTLANSFEKEIDFAFFLKNIEECLNKNRHFYLSPSDLSLLNPNTRNCPIFRNKIDADLIFKTYKKFPILFNEEESRNIWNVEIRQGLVHMTNDSKSNLLYEYEEIKENIEQFLPLYEGRMFKLYNHRAASMGISKTAKKRSAISINTELSNYRDLNYSVLSRFYIRESIIKSRTPNTYPYSWAIGFRNVTATTNERTMIASIIPNLAISYSIRVVFISGFIPKQMTLFLANLNSFCFDYLIRQKLAGINLSNYIIYQMPIIPIQNYNDSLIDKISQNVLELTFTSNDMKQFAIDFGYHGEPFKWDEDRRLNLLTELDAIYFELYKMNKSDIDYILECFPIVKKRDYQKFGEYRTKNLILRHFNEYHKKN